jgi:hypothetical protein
MATSINFSDAAACSRLLSGVALDGGRDRLVSERDQLQAKIDELNEKIRNCIIDIDKARTAALAMAQALSGAGFDEKAINAALRAQLGSSHKQETAESSNPAKDAKERQRVLAAIPENQRSVILSVLTDRPQSMAQLQSNARTALLNANIAVREFPRDSEVVAFVKLHAQKTGSDRGRGVTYVKA